MAKYSYEFKKAVVIAYLNGEGGKDSLAKKFGIASATTVIEWVNNYKAFGENGLKRSRKHETYSFAKKLSVVELYLSSEISHQDLALQEGIKTPSMLANWVNRYRLAGPDALRTQKKGRKKTLDKSAKKTHNKQAKEASADTSAEYIKKLEDELLMLRIENAFLKELRRLRLEDEAKMREQLESLTVSEEDSN